MISFAGISIQITFVDLFAGSQEMSEPLHRFDQDDFHVWITVIQEKCDYIVTTNTRRFPSQIGNIQRNHPGDFYDFLISE
ncbi:PIN domain-containing protein [Oceanobacillus indicireducens]|uniref:PIN domain-containing protein n=1 Tax=Oceanobacillus indicireducens TaxID=1004261 RepID=A0A918D2Q6_9BACI|nr:PIN domain-containing protein [Oceanobacillus indicireducens]GGN61508.1 hypothetical protein GCM10007971_26600 [Oceanobacillus indicireducens]